jgi:hypothetical protein
VRADETKATDVHISSEWLDLDLSERQRRKESWLAAIEDGSWNDDV